MSALPSGSLHGCQKCLVKMVKHDAPWISPLSRQLKCHRLLTCQKALIVPGVLFVRSGLLRKEVCELRTYFCSPCTSTPFASHGSSSSVKIALPCCTSMGNGGNGPPPWKITFLKLSSKWEASDEKAVFISDIHEFRKCPAFADQGLIMTYCILS